MQRGWGHCGLESKLHRLTITAAVSPLAPAGGAALNIGLGLTQNVSREGGNIQPHAARMGTLRTRVQTPSLDNYRSGVPLGACRRCRAEYRPRTNPKR